jgi:flagellar basal body P-ring formation protein FlgA
MRPLVSIFWMLLLGAGAGADTKPWKESWASLLVPMPLAGAVSSSAASDTRETPEPHAPAPLPSTAETADAQAPIVAPADGIPPTFLSPAEILDGLREGLVIHFDLLGELELLPETPLTRATVPDASWRVELLPPLPATLGSRLHLRYRLTNGFEHQPDQSLALRAAWWREAIISNRLLRPGEMDLNGAHEVQTINWLQHRGGLVAGDTDLGQLRLKATWRANEPLRWSMVETRPLIEQGAVVEVVASEGALRISMRGVALENGNRGDLIKLRNVQSRKEIQGIVQNENSVLVVF